ncbi:MAG: hypothetical protein ACFFDB_00755 [Promethearchaeota archaeon]
MNENNNGNKYNFTVEIPSCYTNVINELLKIRAYEFYSDFVEEAIKEFLIKQVYFMEKYGLRPLDGRPIKSVNIPCEYKDLITKFTGSDGIFTGRADLVRQAVREKLEREIQELESKGILKTIIPKTEETNITSTNSGLNFEQLEFLFGDVLKDSPFSSENEVFRIPPDNKERILVKQLRENESGEKEVFVKMLTISENKNNSEI